jgi:hypothetical protein
VVVETQTRLRSLLLLSVERALLGAVSPSLRAVTCGCDGMSIRIRFVFDGPIDADDHESARIVATEVISDFATPSNEWTISEDIVRLDYPAAVSECALDLWAYNRKERATSGDPLR